MDCVQNSAKPPCTGTSCPLQPRQASSHRVSLARGLSDPHPTPQNQISLLTAAPEAPGFLFEPDRARPAHPATLHFLCWEPSPQAGSQPRSPFCEAPAFRPWGPESFGSRASWLYPPARCTHSPGLLLILRCSVMGGNDVMAILSIACPRCQLVQWPQQSLELE